MAEILHDERDWDEDDSYTADGFVDDEDALDEGWSCAYPGNCCMPGLHTREECYTPEMAEAYEREMRETEEA